MLTAIVIGIHLIMSLALIGLVLLHSGKGGGLSDMFGGGGGAAVHAGTSNTKTVKRRIMPPPNERSGDSGPRSCVSAPSPVL